jgi:hypothetical protein
MTFKIFWKFFCMIQYGFKVMTININLCNQALVHVNRPIFAWITLIKAWSSFELIFLLGATLERILKAFLVQLSWINPLNASSILLAISIVIGPIDTYIGPYKVACWLLSFP